MNHETAFVIKPLKSKIVLNRKSVAAFALVDGKDDYKDCKSLFKELCTGSRINTAILTY